MLQGLVHLTAPVSESTGGLVLVDRSHRTVFPRLASDYGDALKKNNADGIHDYFELGADDAAYADPICCRLAPGDLIVWDSRVAHASHPPSRPPADPHALVRLCAYVCMAPPSKDEAVRQARRAAFDDGVRPRPVTSSARVDGVRPPSTLSTRRVPRPRRPDDDALAHEGGDDGRLRELRRAARRCAPALRGRAARRADAGRRGTFVRATSRRWRGAGQRRCQHAVAATSVI